MRLLLAILLAATPVVAGIIDFEDQTDGTVITNQYPGMTFTNATVLTAGISLNEFDFPPHSATNVVFDDGGPIVITFATPVLSFSGYFTYLVPLTINAYDTSNNLIGSVTSAFANNTGTGGDPGSSPNELLTLNVTSIARIIITGDAFGGSLVLDDLDFTSPVPEPSTLALLLVGLPAILRKAYMRQKPRLLGMIPRATVAALLLIILVGCAKLEAAPTIGATNATPGLINTNTPTVVTVTSVITDPALIPTSVNLIRLNPTGNPTIIGQLHDDGQNGDQIAGDKTYTARVTFNEPSETTLRLQVSAAFRGTLQRSTSTIQTVYVTLPGLPPDPGEAGKATLEGIDYDHDGMRDDIQRYIMLTYAGSAKTRAVLMQYAIAQQSFILSGGNKTVAIASARDKDRGYYCMKYLGTQSLWSDLRERFVNTPARMKAYFDADALLSGETFPRPEDIALRAQCSFNPDLLPN